MTNEVELIAKDVPIACSLTADEQVVRGEEIGALFSGIQGTRELADGYALCFPGTPPWSQRVLNFIQGERSCCLFFTFELIFLPNQGPIWLHIRGPEGVREMIADMLTRKGIVLAGD